MLDSLNEPLSEEELNFLGVFLHDMQGPMTLEYLDGYLAALVCSPKFLMPDGFIQDILGDHEFESETEVKAVTSAILRLWNTISNHLSNGRPYPIILTRYQDDEKDEFLGYEWSVGFLSGMAKHKNLWKTLVEDEEYGKLLLPMLALAKDYDDYTKLQIKQISEKERVETLDSIQNCLPIIYRYFLPERKRSFASVNKKGIHYANVKKIGRNEPCPCGSGKKYKHCCGKN